MGGPWGRVGGGILGNSARPPLKRSSTRFIQRRGRGLERGSIARRVAIVCLLLANVFLYGRDLGTWTGHGGGGRSVAASASEAGSGAAPEESIGDRHAGGADRDPIVDVADPYVRAPDLAEISRSGSAGNFTLGPVEWKGADTRFLLYYPLYGQLNNQLISLLDALALAKALSAVLVVPRVGSGFDSRFSKSHSEDGVYILGDYFEWDYVARLQGIISVEDFVRDPVVDQTLSDHQLVLTPTFNSRTLAKEKPFPPYASVLKPAERSKEDVESLKHQVNDQFRHKENKASKCTVWFDLLKEAARRDEAANGRLIIMSCMYQTIAEDWGCDRDMPYWFELRRHLVPRYELRRSVADMYASIKRPVVAMHVRLLKKDETIEEHALFRTLQSVLSAEEVGAIGTIYLAFGNREQELMGTSGADAYLRKSVPQADVVTCADMDNCPSLGDRDMNIHRMSSWASDLVDRDPSLFDDIFRSHYSATLLDMWFSVNSDIFVGRGPSTLSRNVGHWRNAFHSAEAPLETRYYSELAT